MRKAARAIVFKDNDLLVVHRNKFGRQYETLPGGGVAINETPEQTVVRELQEETSLELSNPRLVFIEEAGDPFGTQYIYLMDYVSGEPAINPSSIEASLNETGKNTYLPGWLPVAKLSDSVFLSEALKVAILDGLKNGFPSAPKQIA